MKKIQSDPRAEALKIIKKLWSDGNTLEHIARSLCDMKNSYDGPSVWTVHRWVNGKGSISHSSANRILEVYGK